MYGPSRTLLCASRGADSTDEDDDAEWCDDQVDGLLDLLDEVGIEVDGELEDCMVDVLTRDEPGA
ncbi:MAG: hypothetical protein ACI8PZ_002131 [Myxococcota bacterium]